MSGVVSGTTRALACLALGHDDADLRSCPATDEDLVVQLVEEVQRLRVAAGVVEESEVDRAERVEAVADALTEAGLAEVPDDEFADALVAHLDENGWTLHPVRRP